MSAALQICYTTFDAVFLKLPPEIRARIEAKIDEMRLRLKTFPHHRLKGHDRYRLRVGDYRIIYTFDAVFLKLPPEIRARIEAKIDEMRLRLKTFPHHRLKGHDRYRLRVGDYR